MTSRIRNTGKLEAIIENCRSEGKWPRVIELAEELKQGSPNYGKWKRCCASCELKFDYDARFGLLESVETVGRPL